MKNYTKEIAELNELISEARIKSIALDKANNLKVQSVFNKYFNLPLGYEVKVQNTTAYFQVEIEGRLKELFTISFYERYKQDTILDLSYYTTSTQSDFELDRLMLLGRVAEIVKSSSTEILDEIVTIRKEDLQESNQLYSLQDSYSKQISQYEKAERENEKVQIELALRSGGITFSKELYLKVKRNFTARIVSMKIDSISASRKTCTVSFKYTLGNHTGVEERCDFDSIITQVFCHSKYITPAEELV
jgi:hypothetical protein